MKKLGHILFYSGLVLAVAGFVGDKADNLPWVLGLIAPGYVRASAGLDSLLLKGQLNPGELGFTELEAVVRREAESNGTAMGLQSQQLTQLVRKTAMIAFGEARAGEVVPVDVVFSSTKVGWNMAGLRERVTALKQRSLLGYSAAIFLLGLAITIIGRIIEGKTSKA